LEAIVLAAGFGRGLEPITHTRPKPLLPLLNRTLLEYHLDNLKVIGGISRVVVVASYLLDKVEELIRRIESRYPFDVVVVDQGRPLGTAHALLKGLEASAGDPLLVIYVDSAYSTDDLTKLAESSGRFVVAAYRVEDPRDYGVLVVSPGGTLRNLVEKPAVPLSNLVNAGIYRLDHSIGRYLERVELSPRGEYELTDAIRTVTSEGVPVYVYELSYWRDLGRVWRYLEFCQELLRAGVKGSTILGRVEAGVSIRGPVYVAEGAEVLSGTYISGPAYIGRNAVVGPNAYLRPGAILLNGARIGFSVEVKESIVMEGATAAHLAYIGDSVVCEYANLGAGTVLANLRLDGKEVKVGVKGVKVPTGRRKLGGFVGGYARLGVNVSVNPGVKVGAYSRVFPGVSVFEDVPPCTTLLPDGSTRPIPREECGVDLEVWSGASPAR